MIEIRQVSKHYGGVSVLRDIDIQAQQGEFLVILGSSGAGKSTLLRCVNGLVERSGGTIQIDGVEVNRANRKLIRRKAGFIFQGFNVIGGLTVMQNVLIGSLGRKRAWEIWFSKEDRRLAAEAIEMVGLGEKADTLIDRLSGGQKQRVGIARVLVQQPRVILADEPVSSLDPVMSREILDILKRVNREKNMNVVCNLHQLEYAAEYGDRIVGIHGGTVVFDGTPQELSEQALRRIYGERTAIAETAEHSVTIRPDRVAMQLH